jgi:hypothetical protein
VLRITKVLYVFLGEKNVQIEALVSGSCLLNEDISVLWVHRDDVRRKRDRKISKYLVED